MATRTPSRSGLNTSISMKIRHLSRIAFGLQSASSSTRGAMNAQRQNWRKESRRATLGCSYRSLTRKKMMCSSKNTSIHSHSRFSTLSSMLSPSQEPSLIIVSRNNCLPLSLRSSLVLKSAIKSTTMRSGLSISALEISSRNVQNAHKAKSKSH